MDFQHGGHGGSQRWTEEAGRELSGAVIGCGIRVHSALGPGLLEAVYEECLCHELHRAGLRFRRQCELPIWYDGLAIATRLRLDLVVNERLIVEVKAVERLLPIHDAQLLTYLKLARLKLGLLLNFNVAHFRDGLRRKVL